jgi:RNase P subunit RPR2
VAPKYRKVDPRVWDDEKFIALKERDKLAWFYLLTGPDANAIGLYFLSRERMAKHIGLKREIVDSAIKLFEYNRMIRWDAQRELIWLPNWIDYNMPSGTNQARGYISTAEEYLPHKFAIAFIILAKAVLQCQPGEKAMLSQRQTVAIRDDIKCVYCGKVLEEISDYEMDHVTPKSRSGTSSDRYDLIVASCLDCNHKKGIKTAEEFGHPFVAGRTYSIGEAVIKLIRNNEVRDRFRKLYNGMPSDIAEIDQVADLFEDKTPLKRYSTPFERRSTPFERRHNAVGTQEQEQEQEQDVGTGAISGTGIKAAEQEIPTEQSFKTETVVQTPLFATEDAAPLIFLKIPLIDKTEYELLQTQVDEWQKLYLAIDVPQHCRNYLGWAKANPEKRKTKVGILKSINAWLQDKQNNPKYHKTPKETGGNDDGPKATRNPFSGPEYKLRKRD